jgi:hypothetical protein
MVILQLVLNLIWVWAINLLQLVIPAGIIAWLAG